MRKRKYSTIGIVIKRKNHQEADRILTVFSKQYGKISLIAKGIRKPKSRKRGSLEVFSYIKFSTSYGKFYDIMTEVEIIDYFKNIRKDLSKTAVAYFLLETAEKLTVFEEPNDIVLEILLENLKKLETETKLKSFKEEYIRQILTKLGFWPLGKPMPNPDAILEEVIERKPFSARVGRKLIS